MTGKISSLNLRYIRVREEDRQETFMIDIAMIREIIINRSNSEDRRISFSGRIQYVQNYRDIPRYNQNYRNDFRRENVMGNLRSNQNYRGQNYRDGYRRNYKSDNYERGRSRSREIWFTDNARRNDRSGSSRSRSCSRASTNRDRIRCYKCREYDHFAKDCLTSKIEKETEQAQQMYNMDEEQTSLNISNRYLTEQVQQTR